MFWNTSENIAQSKHPDWRQAQSARQSDDLKFLLIIRLFSGS